MRLSGSGFARFLLVAVSIALFYGCEPGSGQGLPEEPPEASALPFDEDEIQRIGGFGQQPWAFHGGFDFFPYSGGTATFYAVAPGKVIAIEPDTGMGYDGNNGARNYRIVIGISRDISIGYHFEAALDSEGQPLSAEQVAENIYVSLNEWVEAGDAIGILPYRNSSTHVDFTISEVGVDYGPDMPCPLTYFDETAAQRFRDVYTTINTGSTGPCPE